MGGGTLNQISPTGSPVSSAKGGGRSLRPQGFSSRFVPSSPLIPRALP